MGTRKGKVGYDRKNPNKSMYVLVGRQACRFWFDFYYNPSTHFRSFRAQSVTLTTLFLDKPPRQFTSAHSFASN